MALRTGPCDPWPTELCCSIPEGMDAADVARWTLVASRMLWGLSGRRYGPCPVTVRPCRKACVESYGWSLGRWGGAGPWIPYLGRDGMWRNASVCGCASDCSCGELCEVRLQGPVYDVLSVDLGGTVLLPEAYRVDAPNMLVRTDGQCWPDCQDMAAPPGDPNTFTVTYRVGLEIDEAAVAAVSDLTCHYLRGCAPGNCGCKANRTLTRVSRQGMEMEIPDSTLIYSQGLTGLPLVDSWLFMVNPGRLPNPSRVYSPDYKSARTQQWP